jgi:hypothetical protein
VSGEGSNVSGSGTCTDLAGNSASDTHGGIKIDLTPPVATFADVAPVNGAGWAKGPVTVTWNCTDALSGPASSTTTQSVSGEGSNLSGTGTCTDVAGNTGSDTRTGIKIDTTPPQITPQYSTPANGNGWYKAAVTVSFTCTDALSGVAGSPTGGAALSSDTSGALVPGSCTDVAGNTATTNAGPVKIDTTPPVITFQSVSPSPYSSPATVSWTCSDDLSGVVSATVQQVSTNGAPVTGTCTDLAGNTASNTYNNFQVDTTAPGITINAPFPRSYTQGATLFANYSCNALGGSPIAYCTGNVPNGTPVDTSKIGTFTFTVTSADTAGNVAEKSVTYTISAPGN